MPELRPYQEDAVDFMLDAERVILADPPGVGKTATAATWAYLVTGSYGAGPSATPVLFVVPRAVRLHWQREIARFATTEAAIYDGTPKQREAALHESPWVITHYERFRLDHEVLMNHGFNAVVFDEAHRLKNRKAQVTKAAWKMARRTPSIALLTGTPILNRADEQWSLLHMVAPKAYTSYWRWTREHFAVSEEWFKGRQVMVVGDLFDGHADILREQASGFLLQRELKVLLPNLPDVETIVVETELGPEERAAYDHLVEWGWADLDGTVLTVHNAISLTTRLRQFASDWSALSLTKPGAKVVAAKEIIDDLGGEQAVVLTAFKQTARNLAAELTAAGVTWRLYTGDQKAAEREAALEDFKAGRIQVIIGSLATMGEGVDGLQVARHIIFMDRDWTPARNEQALGRIRRSGQEATKVVEWRITALDTIDETIEAALGKKQSVIDALAGRTVQQALTGAKMSDGEFLRQHAVGDALGIAFGDQA